MRGVLLGAHARRRARVPRRAPAITAPTLIVAGGAGSHLPQEEIARMAGRIPRCRLVTVEAGHLVHQQRPEEFAAAVGDFLGLRP